MVLSEGKSGQIRTPSSTIRETRLGPYAETIVNDVGLGRYFEAARYGRLFTSFVRAVTIAATHNTPIAAATATPVVGFLNPVGNGFAAVLLRVAFLTTSGTPAGGQAVLNFISGVAGSITAAVAGNIFNHLLPGANSPQGSTMKPYNNTALTGLSPATGNEIALVGGAAAAAAAGNGGPGVVGEDLGGPIIVPPNTLIALMAGTGAGTTWIVNAALTWAEVDWPLV